MKHSVLIYISTLIVLAALDFTWIGVLARDFYRSRISNLEFHAAPAIAFYLMYSAGIVVFVNGGIDAQRHSLLLYGALFGFFAYATYDLTNLATLRGWSYVLAGVDMLWGAFATALASYAGFMITRYVERM